MVRLCSELVPGELAKMLARFELEVIEVEDGGLIPGSFWGEPEAGIRGATLFVRRDTPVHSALHEACHLLCADAARRATIDTDSGGTEVEESAVCYLQIVLADYLTGVGRERLQADMDEWGYSFRLGSTAAWFQADAEDAVAFLRQEGLLTVAGEPTWRARR